jgi:F-type H+-transporting ATPase subunit b
MISLILAQTTVPAAEAASGITKLFSDFGINWSGFIAQLVSFCFVAFVLWRFAFKPVIATLDERKQKIESGLKYAEEMKAKLDATRQESAELIKKAQLEGAKFIEEARKAAKDFSDREQKAATERANEIVAKAQQAIELEHKKMIADTRGEIARLVVAITQRVLARELSEADRTRYNDSAARELTNVQ